MLGFFISFQTHINITFFDLISFFLNNKRGNACGNKIDCRILWYN